MTCQRRHHDRIQALRARRCRLLRINRNRLIHLAWTEASQGCSGIAPRADDGIDGVVPKPLRTLSRLPRNTWRSIGRQAGSRWQRHPALASLPAAFASFRPSWWRGVSSLTPGASQEIHRNNCLPPRARCCTTTPSSLKCTTSGRHGECPNKPPTCEEWTPVK